MKTSLKGIAPFETLKKKEAREKKEWKEVHIWLNLEKQVSSLCDELSN